MLPNLLIIGSQKCGTSWLFEALKLSSHVVCSFKKELNFFNEPPPFDIQSYSLNFPEPDTKPTYCLECTPHYFRLPWGPSSQIRDPAKYINHFIGDIPLILIYRNPVDRYLSSYHHHIIEGRLPNVPAITDLNNQFGMLELGKYFEIYQHFTTFFEKIIMFDYQDLVVSPISFGCKIYNTLGLDIDFDPKNFDFATNTTSVRALKKSLSNLPALHPSIVGDLNEYYSDDIVSFEKVVCRDLSHWIS